MKREVWHGGLVLLQDHDDGRWRSHGCRKPGPTETPDQFPKMNKLSGSHSTHARLAPSASHQWTNCTGSIAMLEANKHRVPKDDSSIYSNEGTEAHDHAANILLGKVSIDQIPENFHEHVGAYVDHCRSLTGDDAMVEVEVQVPLFYQPGSTGTCDFVAYTDEKVFIRDLKYGAGVLVSSFENEQLAIYGLSWIREMIDGGLASFEPDTVIDIAVFQPRHREGAEQKPWVLTLAELENFCKPIEYAAIQAREGLRRVQEILKSRYKDIAPFSDLDPDKDEREVDLWARNEAQHVANRFPFGTDLRDVSVAAILEMAPGLKFEPSDGDSGACRWCKAKGFCEARLNAMVADIELPQLEMKELLAGMPDMTKEEKKMDPIDRAESMLSRAAGESGQLDFTDGVLTDDYLVRLFKSAKGITAFLDSVGEYLETRVQAGEKISGLKLVLGREGNRAWTDEDAADKLLAQSGKLKMEERYKMSLISPTQAETILKEKIESSTRFKNCFTALVERSPARPVLALEEDKRPAINSPVNDMPVEDDEV